MAVHPLKPLTNAEKDVLWCLFKHGPTWDGNIPSKHGRDNLVGMGFVAHVNGWATLTEEGLQLALNLNLDKKKGTVVHG